MAHKPGSDRLINDRRPFNAGEHRLDWARLPCGTLLTQLVVKDDEEIIASGDDLRNYFYCLKHHDDWVERNVVGEPVSGALFREFGCDPDQDYMVAFRVVVMGDTNACDIAQQTHLEILRDAGCMDPGETLVYATTVPPGAFWEGLYLDDHVMISIEKRGVIDDPSLLRQRKVREASIRAYQDAKLERSEAKAYTEQRRFIAWGTEVDSESGRVGITLQK